MSALFTFMIGILLIRIVSEALTHDLACFRYDNKRVGIDLLYGSPELERLTSSANRNNYGTFGSRVSAVGLVRRRAVLHFVNYVSFDLLGHGGYYGKGFAHIDRVENIVNNEYLSEKTEKGKESRFYIINKECGGGNNKVGEEKRLTYVHVRIFLKYKSNYIRTARR